MLELFQTEWCPASRRIRQRLTELGLDYVNHQVPVEREQRTLLFELTSSDTVPTLLLEDRSALVGEDAILAYLARHYEESDQAEPIEPRRPTRAAAIWRRNADARHWLHTDPHDAAPV
jgi:glutathione S-transferase